MTKENLDQKILSWLNTQGYGVEMLVAESLDTSGFEVIKSSFYEDPETGISREIDVVGRLTDDLGLVLIYSIIECKKSSKPWVIFTTEKTGRNRFTSFAIMSNYARKVMPSHLANMQKIDWYKKPGRQGYGISEAFNLNADVTFKACMTATKAAISLICDQEESQIFKSLSFLFPTVVLDGRLFESYLGEDEKPVITEIDSAFLLFPIKIGDYFGSSVRIVTLKAFNRYCKDVKSVFSFIENEFSEEKKELINSMGL